MLGLSVVLAGCGLGGPKATSDKTALTGTKPAGSAASDPERPEVKVNGPKIAGLALTAPIYEGPHHKAKAMGYLRLGEALPRSERPVQGDGQCAEGWYAVHPRGYVCADGKEATLDLGHKIIRALGVKPDLSKPMPYTYGFVRANGALYHQVPVKKDQDRFEFGLPDHLKGFKKFHTKWNRVEKAGANHVVLDEKGNGKGLPKEVPPPPPQADEDNLFGNLEDGDTPWWLRGRRQIPNISTFKAPEYAVFNGKVYRHAGLAVVGSFRADEKAGNRKFTVLLDGRIVGEDKLKPHYASPFHGIPLDGSLPFPFAIVRKQEATYFEPRDHAKWGRGDEAEFREIVPLTGNTKLYPSTKYYETRDGKWLRMDQISVFNAPEMPKRFDYRTTKWIDVSIWQQTLVLYEGEKPVYATLVSTGADGMGDPETTKSTIRGEFRIDYKHVTATMDADDPENRFELRDVPWVQYFERGYALHTAYWHDDFGTPRSHGCINLAPVDARRVFFWTDPPLPASWHGVKSGGDAGPGTWVRVRGLEKATPGGAVRGSGVPSAPAMARHPSPETILDASTTLRGRLTGEGDVRVYGAIQGEVVLRGTLAVGEGGVVNGGAIEATAISVEGQLTGEIQATEALVVHPSGSLHGRIRAGSLQIHEGATLACDLECEFDLPQELLGDRPRR
jgi:cytoskeletal protein CcmA (bactofilin family)